MSTSLIRASSRDLVTATLLAVGLAVVGPCGSAAAEEISDPPGDFLPTYTGPQDAGLDVVAHEAMLRGNRLIIFGRMSGPIDGPAVAR